MQGFLFEGCLLMIFLYYYVTKCEMKSPDNDTIAINRAFEAAVQNVWKSWTDPAIISKWFGSDPEGKVLKASTDVRPGGLYEITFKDSDETEHTCFGVYSVVEEFRKLSFTWTWKSEPGVESVVIITLNPEGESTRMLFEHSGVGADSKHNYTQGWKDTFSKLQLVLKQLQIL
jgi:uncharacterized protein YndB with AHSA1/START domain